MLTRMQANSHTRKIKNNKTKPRRPGEEAEAVGRPKVSLMLAWATENKPCLKQNKTNLTGLSPRSVSADTPITHTRDSREMFHTVVHTPL